MTSERKIPKPIRRQLELKRKSNRKSDGSSYSFFFWFFFLLFVFCRYCCFLLEDFIKLFLSIIPLVCFTAVLYFNGCGVDYDYPPSILLSKIASCLGILVCTGQVHICFLTYNTRNTKCMGTTNASFSTPRIWRSQNLKGRIQDFGQGNVNAKLKVKMAGYWSSYFTCFYGSRRTQDVNKNAETKERKRPIFSNQDRKLGQKETKEKRREKGGTKTRSSCTPR